MIAAIAVCAVLIIATITGLYYTWRDRDTLADPADIADPDGSVWLRSLAAAPDQPAPRARELHHELSPFPAAGWLPMLPPDPPPDDTRPQPVLKDVAACELGMAVQDYIDGVFAPAEATIKALIDRYAEVTG